LTTLHFDVRRVEQSDHPSLAEKVLLAQAGELSIDGVFPILPAHGRR